MLFNIIQIDLTDPVSYPRLCINRYASLSFSLTFSISKCGGQIMNFWHSSAEVGNDVEKGAKL